MPDWIEDRLGRYYLYFAHHDGDYIRLAFSDSVEGPWTLFRDGVLPLRESYFAGHVASPDAHVDFDRRQIRLYYHGSDSASEDDAPQTTRIAVSDDGLHFRACEEALGPAYFRVFKWRDFHYALAMPGVFLRSEDGLLQLHPRTDSVYSQYAPRRAQARRKYALGVLHQRPRLSGADTPFDH